MLRDYLPALFQILAAMVIAGGALITSIILGKKGRPNEAKDIPYECGKNPIGPNQTRFSVKFYLVAMIFILFDIEVIFMYPWALSYLDFINNGMGSIVLGIMLLFVLILEVGHLYAYKKGVFDWTNRQ